MQVLENGSSGPTIFTCEQLRSGECYSGLSVLDNRLNSWYGAGRMGQVSGNGYRSSVEAAEERSDVLKTWWVEKQHTFPGSLHLLEQTTDDAGLSVQLLVGPTGCFC